MSKLLDRIKQNSTIRETDILTESKFFNEKDLIQTSVPAVNVALSGKLDGGLTPGLTVFAGPSKHFKTAFACSSLIMVLFGIALSIQKPRSNFANSIGLSITVIFLYYILIKLGQTLGYNNIINPFLSVWMVNILFLILGVNLFIKART